MTSVFYKAMNNLQGEISCWSLFGLTAKSPKVWAPLINSTFFHADINQSEVEGSFQLASYWIINLYEGIKSGHTFGLHAVRVKNWLN